jgi:hypothetical protein
MDRALAMHGIEGDGLVRVLGWNVGPRAASAPTHAPGARASMGGPCPIGSTTISPLATASLRGGDGSRSTPTRFRHDPEAPSTSG